MVLLNTISHVLLTRVWVKQSKGDLPNHWFNPAKFYKEAILFEEEALPALGKRATSLNPEFGKKGNKIKHLLVVCPTQIAVFQVDII